MDRKKLKWTVLRLLAELLVVFLGVYAAFLLDDYRMRQRAEAQRERIREGLYEHVAVINSELGNAAPYVDSLLTEFEQAVGRGERPEPGCLDLGSGLGAPDVWNAALEAGGLDVIDVELLTSMSEFYLGAYNTVGQIERMRGLCDEYVVPRLDEGVGAFYDSTGRFNKAYQWYLPTMRDVLGGMNEWKERSDSLLVMLEPAF